MFKKWGLPKAIRTDNGPPFGITTRDAIPIMSLWLCAFAIKPILNRPKRPQDNGTVERAQGTSARWAEIKKAAHLTDLQDRLDAIITEQRDKYPVKRLKSACRTQVFPQLYHIYRPLDEQKFDVQAAYQFLASKTLQRKTSTGGFCSLYGKNTYIDHKLKGNLLYFKFDASKLGWNVVNANNEFLKFIPDNRFSKDNIFLLTVCQ